MLRFHTRSPKGGDQNLLSNNSVAGAEIPSSLLVNPNVHWLLISEHLTNHALPKSLYLSSYHALPKSLSLSSYICNFPKGSSPSIQSISQTVSYLGGDLVLTHIQLHQITEEWKTTVIIFLFCFNYLFRMQRQINR